MKARDQRSDTKTRDQLSQLLMRSAFIEFLKSYRGSDNHKATESLLPPIFTKTSPWDM